jgi:hypothetical protein
MGRFAQSKIRPSLNGNHHSWHPALCKRACFKRYPWTPFRAYFKGYPWTALVSLTISRAHHVPYHYPSDHSYPTSIFFAELHWLLLIQLTLGFSLLHSMKKEASCCDRKLNLGHRRMAWGRRRVQKGRRRSQADCPASGSSVSGVARPQDVEGSGMAGLGETLGSPWPPLAMRP